MLLFSFKIFTGLSVLWEASLVFNFLISFTTFSNGTFKNSNFSFVLTFLVASILEWFLYLKIAFKTGCEILSARVSAS